MTKAKNKNLVVYVKDDVKDVIQKLTSISGIDLEDEMEIRDTVWNIFKLGIESTKDGKRVFYPPCKILKVIVEEEE